jgi:predicted ABC-type ATPase
MKKPRGRTLYLISGPNGAGKTTCAFSIMPELIDCYEYVNADAIASALSPFKPFEVSVDAGRVMLQRIRILAESGVTFAFEATLASKSLAPFLEQCRRLGYSIRLIYIWLNSVELAVERVKRRVESGGHYVPESIVRRRYGRSLQNFFRLYSPLVDEWSFYDNSLDKIELVAENKLDGKMEVLNITTWRKIITDLNNESK